jgi:hypothetical protein
VMLSFGSKLGLCRRAGALVLITLAALAYGCGSSEQNVQERRAKAPRSSLKDQDHYRWEGEGKAKHKVYLNRREEDELLIERAKKPD